ncbi:hypothetical protein K435DRAFT_790982 [Dendrothele bispora CBS 962.96]|uniref:Uncharacterized protein n=1 Tax=Dendrothele bispora (strain CBS 962.96) TaxID=1314807 RepID=A0A4V4HHX6_DENBC|nr:hypothetical protein K435DRAFT_790982 [Dendrothele bispora CBS 962.96]
MSSQSGMNGRQLDWPRGKVLGGSSAVNEIYLVRPNGFSGDDSGSSSPWAWDSFYAAMKKAETFDAPSDDIKNTAGIEYNEDSYGTNGPTHWGYPGFCNGDRYRLGRLFQFDVLSFFVRSESDWKCNMLCLPLHLNKPSTWNKEVILSAGTIGSAQILMVSGVRSQIRSYKTQVLDGKRLQDHLVTSLAYSTTSSVTTAGSIHASPQYTQIVLQAAIQHPLSMGRILQDKEVKMLDQSLATFIQFPAGLQFISGRTNPSG